MCECEITLSVVHACAMQTGQLEDFDSGDEDFFTDVHGIVDHSGSCWRFVVSDCMVISHLHPTSLG